MRVFFHCALDGFGAESLARFAWHAEALADPSRERHVYLWLATQERPTQRDYWERQYPVWANGPVIPPADSNAPLGLAENGDVGILARRVSEWISSISGENAKFFKSLQSQAHELVGKHPPPEILVSLVGSLAEPGTGATVYGILDGLARLKQTGNVGELPVFGLFGIGRAGGPTDGDDSVVRCTVARSLLDLQVLSESALSEIAGSSCPFFLVGEKAIAKAPSDRPTQVAMSALALTAIVMGIVADDEELGQGNDRLVDFGNGCGDSTHICGSPFAPSKPFVAVGGYSAFAPTSDPSWIIASHICENALSLLSIHPSLKSIDDVDRLEIPTDMETFLRETEAAAVDRMWNSLSESTRITWRGNIEHDQIFTWFDVGRMTQLLTPLRAIDDWIRLEASFGEARFESLPFRVWKYALQEYDDVVTQLIVPRREERLRERVSAVLAEFIRSLDIAIDEVFARAFGPPVGSNPHWTAQVLVARLVRECKRHLYETERTQLATGDLPTKIQHARQDLMSKRRRFEDALDGIPSPVAVFLRLVPVFVLVLALALVAPLPAGFDSMLTRALGGSLLGIALSYAVYWRYIESIWQRMRRHLRAWLSAYNRLIEFEDEYERMESFRTILKRMGDCAQWMFEGTQDAPPVPETLTIRTDRRKEGQGDAVLSIMRPSVALRLPREDLTRSIEAFRELRMLLLRRYQASMLEVVLPEISMSDPKSIAKVLRYCQHEFDLDESGNLTDQMRRIKEWASRADRARCLLFERPAAGSNGGRAASWRRILNLPSGEVLLSESDRKESICFRFLETVYHYVASELLSESSPARWRQIQSKIPDGGLSESLSARMTRLCDCSVELGTGAARFFTIAAGVDDPFMNDLQVVNDLGKRRLSARLQVRVFLNAMDVIFVPNSHEPRTQLGRAWGACLQEGWQSRYPVLQQIARPEERAT